ncbi:GNAT family N-acetyltransferase [Iodobacter ciconiae]|nr:GNAT family N-acetyltransferase [Iodobacter ciconiae]
MNIVAMTPELFTRFWPVFSAIIQAEETYAFDPCLNEQQAFDLWCTLPVETYAAVENNTVLGSYFIKANASGPGAHVSNCGYMVADAARGKGAAKVLCQHSKQRALAMQFNAVVSSNTVAVALWQKLGFEVIGRVPKAYRHKQLGFVDTLVMYQWLAADESVA